MSELALLPGAVAELPKSSPAELHRQLDELHQMIYRRGGIRPVNAAIEELTKLLLLELKLIEIRPAKSRGEASSTRSSTPTELR